MRGAIRRTTSAPPRQITRQGRTPKRTFAALVNHSNAPIRLESQSHLSKIIAHFPHLPSTFAGAVQDPTDGATMLYFRQNMLAADKMLIRSLVRYFEPPGYIAQAKCIQAALGYNRQRLSMDC